MINIITQKVDMPELKNRRFQKYFLNNIWFVEDALKKSIRYKSKNYENVSIACHNLNKKFYQKGSLK